MDTSDRSSQDVAATAILDLVLTAPPSTERTVLDDPSRRAKKIARSAARKASLLSGSLALPPGLLGWLTVLPEIYGVWKVQAQMISDIAAVYGKRSNLRREHMIYCLFKHVAAQLLRDVVVRVGERVIVQQTSLKIFQTLVQKLGVQLTTTVIGKSASRFIPLLGAATVSAYSYFDTLQVAKTAVDLFESDLVFDMPAGP
jgi:hypothetical protein